MEKILSEVERPQVFLRRWLKTGHRAPERTSTVNVSIATHQRLKKVRDLSGLNYDEIVKMAMDLFEKTYA